MMKTDSPHSFRRWIAAVVVLVCATASSYGWRSSLYPVDWEPGFGDSEGRFLHDFSYAGYKSGLEPIPDVAGPVFNVIEAPYNADNTGERNATAAIQAAIDAAKNTGGGVVYLPAGIYKVRRPSLQEDARYVFLIDGPNVVIRGEGSATRVLNTGEEMRRVAIFSFNSGSAGNWYPEVEEDRIDVVRDELSPTKRLKLASIGNYKEGDYIVIRTDNTDAFRADHKTDVPGKWKRANGLALMRRIVEIDVETLTIGIDAPTRYPMKVRDGFRIYRVDPKARDSGIEDLAIGMEQFSGSFYDNDFRDPSKIAYKLHGCSMISFSGAVDCWARRIHSFRPESNQDDYHILSHGIVVRGSRHVTIEECDIRNPQYEGNGGNGYLYSISSQDCLYRDNKADHGRHNYSFLRMRASGNVLLRNLSRNPRYTTDFHMYLSHSNLIDGMILEGDTLEAAYRGFLSTGAAHTASQNVFWNTRCDDGIGSSTVAVKSMQWGHGYVIGTSGAESDIATERDVSTRPHDWREGVGEGATLVPASLYEEQLAMRIAREGRQPPVADPEEKAPPVSDSAWRSSLFPTGWEPGFSDSAGRFLHDFSYAGYRSGLEPIPDVAGPVFDVTEPPYGADSTGTVEATAAIQSAIDAAEEAGGGVVYLPKGIYKVRRPSMERNHVLRVDAPNVVIRGDGSTTRILNIGEQMRETAVFEFTSGSEGSWYPDTEVDKIDVVRDEPLPTKQIKLASLGSYREGDMIIIRTDNTEDFKADHKSNHPEKWKNAHGLTLMRAIVGIDRESSTITIDAPTRYPMKTRDGFRIYRVDPVTRESGIENLAIGMKQLVGAFPDGAFDDPSELAYQMHRASMLSFDGVVDCWARNISSFRPETNVEDFHILSHGIWVRESRHVTIANCDIRKPQYEGGGDNGYPFAISSQDSLYQDNLADNGRHNYSFAGMGASGNVLLGNESRDPRYASDFHKYLSHANLIDSMTLRDDSWMAANRGFWDGGASHTSSQNVFWNVMCDDAYHRGTVCVTSKQWGSGYVIGTSGAESGVSTEEDVSSEPDDWEEGEGMGATLEPVSLYEDQLAKRMAREAL